MGETPNSKAPGSPSSPSSRLGRRRHESFVPAYIHIANTIAEQIGAGVYRPGDQLPTEAQLRATHGVSPVTIRRAVSILLERGLVRTTQGKGTFVRSPDLRQAVFRLQEITDMWVDNATVNVRLLEARIHPAGDEVATMLELDPGEPVVYMRRLISRRDLPLIYQVEYVVYDEHRPLVETQLQITSLEGLLQASRGEGIPSGQLTIHACSVNDEAARLLEVPDASPGFCLEHLFLSFDGRPVSWGRFLCRADQFRLTTHIGVPRRSAGES